MSGSPDGGGVRLWLGGLWPDRSGPAGSGVSATPRRAAWRPGAGGSGFDVRHGRYPA
jgi:hypothetical protein